MRYTLLGHSGLRVSEMCLGAMAFGEGWGWGAGESDAAEVFAAFAEAGGNFIDTANNYTGGTSERYVGQLIATDRDSWVLATKYTLTENPSDPNGGGNHRKSLVRTLEASLRRLNTDRIDLYWLHLWDFVTPIEEVMRALDDQVRLGKILYVGISDTPAWVVARGNTLAELRGWTPFVALQLQYSLLERGIERELLPLAQHLELAVTAWSPLGFGLLSGKYRRGETPSPEQGRLGIESLGAMYLTERNFDIVDAVRNVATEAGVTPAQVALAWLRQRPGVIIPILGARKASQIRDNLAATELELTPDQLSLLTAASAIERGFPYDFMDAPGARALAFGDTLPLLDDHRRDRSGRGPDAA